MPNTMTLINAVTVGAGGSSTISFSSIPQTYTDLVLKFSGKSNNAGVYEFVAMRFNSNSSSSYTTRVLRGSGSAVTSQINGTTSFEFEMVDGDGSQETNTFGNMEIYIPNYAGSNNKSVSTDGVSEGNRTLAYAGLNAGLFSNTAAVTSIALTTVAGTTWLQHSTAYLYGIVKQ